MTEAHQIAAIRAVRIAAHELANVCAAIVGGVPMAISTTYEDTVGETTRGICPKPMSAGDVSDKAPGQP